MNNFLLINIFLIILFEALCDGFRYKYEHAILNEKQTYGILYHTFKIFMIFTFLNLAFFFDFISVWNNYLNLLLGYFFLRFGIFDFIFNKLIGQHFLYIGSTSIYDLILAKIFYSADSKMILYLLKGMSIMLGMYIIQHKIQLL